MSAESLIPWFIVAVVLLVSWRQHQLYKEELAARVRAEVTSQAKELALQRTHQAVESAADAIAIVDFCGASLYQNQANFALFGYTLEELNALPGAAVLFAKPSIADEIQASLQKGISWSGEIDLKAKAGRVIPAFVRADVIRDEQSQPVGIFCVFTDITGHRERTKALSEERRRLEVTIDSIGDAIVTTDTQGHVSWMNRAAEQLTGWSHAEACGQSINRVVSLLDETSRCDLEVPVRADGDVGASSTQYLGGVLVTRDCRERLVAAVSTALGSETSAPRGRVLILRDITNERRVAGEKERVGRLESLALLAGIIAHDFANLLTGILGHLSLAQTADGVSEEIAMRLSEVEHASLRARDLTKQLLTFAKGGTLEKRTVELGAVIREAIAFAMHDAGAVVTECQISEDLWPIEADESQLGQVITNLALNAVQAMSDRGLLRISACNVEAAPASIPDLGQQAAVHVSVVDTGPGIPAENLGKIFDPFFTTKSKGVGLGLATVYSIVRKHGGHVQVESKVGFGTRFDIYLPVERVPAPIVQSRMDG